MNNRNVINNYDIYRIRNWYYYLGFPVLGYTISGCTQFKISIFLTLIIGTSFALAFVYSLNDFADNDTKKKYFIAPSFFLVLCLFWFRPIGIIALLFFILLHSCYSLSPFRFKQYPIIGTLCNAIAFPQLFLLGYLNDFYIDIKGIFILVFLFLSSIVIELIHEVNHFEQDKVKSDITTAVLFGRKKILTICSLLLICTILTIIAMFLFNVTNIAIMCLLIIFQLIVLINIVYNRRIDYKTWVLYRVSGIIVGSTWFVIELYKKYSYYK